MNRFSLLIFILLPLSFPFKSHGKGNDIETVSCFEKEFQSHQSPNSLAEEQILHLKKGVLLVRLQNKSNAINALKARGDNEKADKVIKEQRQYNLQVIKSFRSQFNFCPAYFFYSDYTEDIINGDLDKVVFLDDSLVVDPSLKIADKYFLTAEFGKTKADTGKYYSDSRTESVDDWDVKKTNSYYGGPETGLSALVIMSDKFIQLRKPFPYYNKIYQWLTLEESLDKTVTGLNEKLSGYYKMVRQLHPE